MSDPVSEVFGYVMAAAAVLLAVRERHAFRHRGADAWLITRRRYRRRLFISAVLFSVGIMLAAWGRGAIEFRDAATGALNPLPFTIFVFALTGLALLLIILAGVDFTETASNASRHALEEFALPADKLEPERKDPPPPGQEQ